MDLKKATFAELNRWLALFAADKRTVEAIKAEQARRLDNAGPKYRVHR